MKAAVLYAPRDIRVTEVERPHAGPGEAVVRVAACGVCGSDIPRINLTGAHKHPIIPGHEFSGVITEVGTGVNIKPGTLVAVPPLLPCNLCASCKAGDYSLCENYDYFGSRRDGAYAEYVAVPTQNLFVVPSALDPRAAAMLDPSAIALHAIWKLSISKQSRVAVIGAGPIGLFAIEWAKFYGAQTVAAFDIAKEKGTMATEAGADAFYSDVAANSNPEALEFDAIIESSGAPAGIRLSVTLAARNSAVAYIGIPHSEVVLPDRLFSQFQRREVILKGSWNSFSSPFPGGEWVTAAREMNAGTIAWQFMITHELGLDSLPEIMSKLADRSISSSKILFMPTK